MVAPHGVAKKISGKRHTGVNIGSWGHRDHMPLIVGHTHSHSDHVAGDVELQALGDPDIPITYVAPTVDATKKLYGIANWPEDVGSIFAHGKQSDVPLIAGYNHDEARFFA